MKHLILIGVTFFSCASQKVVTNSDKNIRGQWCLTLPLTHVLSLDFVDDSLVFVNTAKDTLYSYLYKLDRDNLILTGKDKKEYYHHVTRKSGDSLMLKSFLDNSTEHIFVRCDLSNVR